MRRWAEDLDRLHKTPPEELARLQALPREDLTPEQSGLLLAHDKHFVEAERGIHGSLRPDNTVELDGGRHRAGYILESGTEPIPVWVSAPDEARLDAFEAVCERETGMRSRGRPAREEPQLRDRAERSEPIEGRERGRE
jgi:hypothetical protein